MQETTKIDFNAYHATYQWPLSVPIPQSGNTKPPYRDTSRTASRVRPENHLYRPNPQQHPSRSIPHPGSARPKLR